MKRVLAMAAAACMVLALAGCKPGATSSQTPDASGGTDPSGNGSKVNPDGAHAALKFPAEDFNLGGKKIVIATWDNVSMPPEAGTASNDMTLARMEKIMQKYGVEVEWKSVSGGTYDAELTTALYSNVHYADIVYLNVPKSIGLIKNGVFKPLDEYVDFSAERFARNEDLVRFNDKHYGIPITDPSPYVVIYNPAILKSSGADDPLTLFQQGTWTWEAMKSVAEKCAKDFNGDGKNDQFGLNTTSIRFMLPLNGVVGFGSPADNKFTVDLFDQPSINALEYYQSLSVGGLLDDPETWYDWGANIQNFVSGKTAMLMAPMWEAAISVYGNGFKEFSVVPAPMGPDVPEGEYVIADPYGAMALIPENTSVDVKQLLTFYLAYTYNDPADPETYVDPDENLIEDFSAGHHWRTADEIMAYTNVQRSATVKNTYFVQGTQLFHEPHTMFESHVITPVYNGDSVKNTLDTVKDSILAMIAEIESR